MGDTPGPLGTIGLAAITFYVNDLDAAIVWYDEKLGLTPMTVGADAERYASYLIGGSILVLEPRTAAMEPAAPGSESTTVNLLVVRDPEEVRTELLARGVRCSEVLGSPHYRSFLVRDLDGNRFYVSRPASEQARQDVVEATAVSSAAPSSPS
jgi:catechol 2,3-dioxygenase-like lactoylglutathione lyase family enzyme